MQRLARWNKTENDSRLLENSEGISDGEWNFVEGRRETLLYSCKWQEEERSEKNLRSQLVIGCPKLDGHNQRT